MSLRGKYLQSKRKGTHMPFKQKFALLMDSEHHLWCSVMSMRAYVSASGINHGEGKKGEKRKCVTDPFLSCHSSAYKPTMASYYLLNEVQTSLIFKRSTI